MKINIVLHEPEIPQNTGNIARTCAATGASLHLIKPLGFELDNAKMKRAGLDYWDKLDTHIYENLDDFFEKNPCADFLLYTTKAPNCYADPSVSYKDNVFLFFGRESAGLPESLLEKHLDKCVRIPMRNGLRSLNLSNSVAIAVYEALRRNDFAELEEESQYFAD